MAENEKGQTTPPPTTTTTAPIVEEAATKANSLANLLEDAQDDDELANIVTAEEYLQHKDCVFLEYEKQMFLDLVHNDGLLVCAKGLSYEKALLHILKAYSDNANLILVINSSDTEEHYYKPRLEQRYVHEVANTATERERVYLEGGIQFISTRILVVDMLKQRVPIELITGIIVLRAHKIIESCQEAFALRLYRQQNKTGFIKGFSGSAEAFTIGYAHIERIMRNLFVKQLYIWPRFHATVQAALKPWHTTTIELHVPLTQHQTLIQTHILDIMNYLVREIKRINRTVDMEAITVENCVTKQFHKILQAQLDCIWHQLNSQTKLIVADLKILRSLMISTMYHDAVTSYAMIKRYRGKEYALSNSGWTLLDAAEQIFKLSKHRVFNDKEEFEPEPCPKWMPLSELLIGEIPCDMKKRKDRKSDHQQPKVLILCQDSRTCYQLKQYLTQGGPRFLLQQAMRHEIAVGKMSEKYIKSSQELPKATQSQSQSSSPPAAPAAQAPAAASTKSATKSAIKSSIDIAKDDSIIPPHDDQENELKQLLTAPDVVEDQQQYFQESYNLTMTQPPPPPPTSDHIKVEEEEDDDDDETEEDGDGDGEAAAANVDDSIFEVYPDLENFNVTAAITELKQPFICIQTFKSEREGTMSLETTLEQLQPHYVIMYNTNVAAIRQLEIYEARCRRSPRDRLKVFFLLHARTVEEQSYLTSLRREKAAFELIIDTKSKMVIPEYQDGKTDEAFILYKPHMDDPLDEAAANAKSRQSGGQQSSSSSSSSHPVTTPKVIVDMREFRSDLPCLIHKRGIEVIPVTISIGDYILTPEVCVERKSISDLIGSLNSGRLYNQCVQMQRHYAKPILLIEFDQSKPFHLQGKFMLSQQTTATNADIMQKLQLLTLHFPRLRLIWSPSPYATAQLFEELKLGKPEPDAKQAAAVGGDEGAAGGGGGGGGETLLYNTSIYDFLLRLPGIHTRNINSLLRGGGNMRKLLALSQSELSDLLQSQQSGKLLWDILHVTHFPEKDEVSGAAALLAAGKQFGNNSHNRYRKAAAAANARRHK